MRNAAEIYISIALGTVFMVLLIGIILASMLRYYKRRKAHELAIMQFDQVLLQSRLEIQEQTFTSISQELHDNIGQLLTLVKLNLNTLNFADPDKAMEKVQDSTSLVSRCMQALRDLAKSINGAVISQQGLLPALEGEIRIIEKLGIMHPVFRVFGEPAAIDEKKSLIIFRIVQEALHNVLKHAAASVIEMQVHFKKEEISVAVIDNGKGIVPGAALSDGSGLRNMNDRARIIGARFEVGAAENGGTIITLTIPQTS